MQKQYNSNIGTNENLNRFFVQTMKFSQSTVYFLLMKQSYKGDFFPFIFTCYQLIFIYINSRDFCRNFFLLAVEPVWEITQKSRC